MTAILLLLQIVSNNAFAEELLKMPKLFTHFYHHSQEHRDGGNFLDYLQNHYSDHLDKYAHAETHSEEDEDCNLPFKHCGDCCMSAHVPVVGYTASYLVTDYNLYQTISFVFIYEDDRIESQDLSSVWQPPKIS